MPGNYCQPWNPDYFQCRPELAQCGTPEVGVDFYGDDLFDVVGLRFPDECCDECAATSGCIAFTFINYDWDDQTHCYQKSATGTKKGVPGAVSTVVTSACHTQSGGYCGNDKGTLCCPDTTYCQPWNSQYYQCIDTPERCPTQLTDVDFYGNDMGVSFGGYPWDAIGTKKSIPGAVSAAVTSPRTSSCSTQVGGYCGNKDWSSCCPYGSYCQPWNSGYYQCVKAPKYCSTQLTDVDFHGNDLGVVYGLHPTGCCEKCTQTAGCVAYTFVNDHPGKPACYLKSSIDGKRRSVEAVSGKVD
ncbi:hypothetical protein PHYSODRAFT_532067, partial [Phytophthora sojae]